MPRFHSETISLKTGAVYIDSTLTEEELLEKYPEMYEEMMNNKDCVGCITTKRSLDGLGVRITDRSKTY